MKKLLLLAVAVLGYAVGPVGAAQFYTIDTPNSGLSPYPGDYATVTVTRIDSTHATIQFVANLADGFMFVDGGAVDFNLNGDASSIDISALAPSGIQITSEGSGNADGWGTFNQRFTSGTSSPEGRFTAITFDIIGDGTTWASDADVLCANNQGNFLAAHIGVGGLTGDLAITGFASTGDGTNSVPDGGSTLLLLGSVLSGLGLLRGKLS